MLYCKTHFDFVRSLSTLDAFCPTERRCFARSNWICFFAVLFAGWYAGAGIAQSVVNKTVHFSSDIQPILAEKCWKCHGVDEQSRQAELRLDLRDSAILSKAIIPGKPSQSQLIERILEQDDSKRMPPPESKKSLSNSEIQLISDWIQQGAPYDKHWAFEKPVKPVLPATSGKSWSKDPIDAFVLARIEQQGWKPSPEADRATLLRRVSLDLTGLPPSRGELADFLSDPSNNAYEKVVDRLLGSRRYAEKMAMHWLDAARYADTNGYNNDEDRTMWPWRDWVIDAFDRNMPYDQFIVEQLAGDMLPNPTTSQKLATAFHRNLGHNTEGGIVQEEYRVEYVADRVHTTATIFMGLSMQCARCHDHKYDPISQREYYQFYSFFNQMEEKQGSYSKFKAAEPFLSIPTSSEQVELDLLENRRKIAVDTLVQLETEADGLLEDWSNQHSTATRNNLLGSGLIHQLSFDSIEADTVRDQVRPTGKARILGSVSSIQGKFGGGISLEGNGCIQLENFAPTDGTKAFSIGVWIYPKSNEIMAVFAKMDESHNHRGFDLLLEDGKITSHLIHSWPENAIKVQAKSKLKLDTWQHVLLCYDGKRSARGVHVFVEGKSIELNIQSDNLTDSIDSPKPFSLGRRDTSYSYLGWIDELQIYDQELVANDAADLANGKPISNVSELLAIPKTKRSELQQTIAKKFYLERIDPLYPKLKLQVEELLEQKRKLESALSAVMIMQDMDKPRDTFVLKRGQYDQPGEQVSAGVPAALTSSESTAPRNRLGLAQWLVARNHPLTARVAVNRWWQMVFGNGIVRTTEDFGVTGEPPTHPELLDYLATELLDSHWDVKAMLKRIVTSATYRQDSRIHPEQWQSDPENRLLARGARFRVSAETIRDNALAIAGLLSDRVGGPSVKPYQPAGLWEDVTVERRGKYVEDRGEDLYRRSMYTFWKRTCPPPSMMSFDAPNREVCLARRAQTNTPLQSLILLNDPTYVEASRKLAERMILLGGPEPFDRLAVGYQLGVAREPNPEEQKIVFELLLEVENRFRTSPQSAAHLLAVGESKSDESINRIELACWTIIASTIMNLDETVTKR